MFFVYPKVQQAERRRDETLAAGERAKIKSNYVVEAKTSVHRIGVKIN